jgi:hypothetical protein
VLDAAGYQMNVAAFFFTTGALLGMFCGFRLFVRHYQFIHARQRTPQPWNPVHELILPIRLKDTLVLEVFGWLVATAMWLTAAQFM